MAVDLIARGIASSIMWASGETGEVVGALSSIPDDIVIFDGDTGKALKDSGHRISDLVMGNDEISASTHTKITYDSKGLVTSGSNATTADINESANRNYITDSQVLDLSGLTSNVQDQLINLNESITGETYNRANEDKALLDLFTGRTITAGDAMVGGGNLSSDITISHLDTSDAQDIISTGNTNGTVIQNISEQLDTYGHITGNSISTYDLDNRYYTEDESDNRFVNITGDSMSGKLTINNNLTVTDNTIVVGGVTGNTFTKYGGTWQESLMADGSVSAPSVSTVSMNYNIQITDKIIKATVAGITITLPTAIGITGVGYKIDNASSGNIYLATVLSQLIEGLARQTIPSDSCADVYSDGSNYRFE